ncbi:hypothetical protein EYF80_016099 [Liparis tanakae]|uniref:Uncharacterized protein n=1 Tax=Liparis tanakae TaxID=230148 RepID=A0A4Z2I6N1_9TELE|nr:hypothetical protein EYF80_016099 [Liparis tanakae]
MEAMTTCCGAIINLCGSSRVIEEVETFWQNVEHANLCLCAHLQRWMRDEDTEGRRKREGQDDRWTRLRGGMSSGHEPRFLFGGAEPNRMRTLIFGQ